MIHIYYKLGISSQSEWHQLDDERRPLETLVETLKSLAVFATSKAMGAINIATRAEYKITENDDVKFRLSFRTKDTFIKTIEDLQNYVERLEKEEK